MRSIAVLTATRADAGPLGPVISELGRCPEINLTVIAGGTHYDDRRGNTIDALNVPAGARIEKLASVTGSSASTELVRSLATFTSEVGEALSRVAPDLLVVVGDRWELLGACGAALLLQVPVVHLHGGEITEGALDDRVRAAITKLADLHLCATEDARRRILQLGEEPWRVHRVGAPALDRFHDIEAQRLDEFAHETGLPPARPFGIVTYHPPTVGRTDVGTRAEAVFEAAATELAAVVVTAPGADPGADEVLAAITSATEAHDHLIFLPNLGHRYPALLAAADVMVGNSSSGIVEAASFRLPVVDVGDRQRGRLAGPNVVHCGESSEEIACAIREAVDPAFRAGLEGLLNPYGDGNASPQIVEVLISADLSRLARKRFVDLEAP